MHIFSTVKTLEASLQPRPLKPRTRTNTHKNAHTQIQIHTHGMKREPNRARTLTSGSTSSRRRQRHHGGTQASTPLTTSGRTQTTTTTTSSSGSRSQRLPRREDRRGRGYPHRSGHPSRCRRGRRLLRHRDRGRRGQGVRGGRGRERAGRVAAGGGDGRLRSLRDHRRRGEGYGRGHRCLRRLVCAAIYPSKGTAVKRYVCEAVRMHEDAEHKRKQPVKSRSRRSGGIFGRDTPSPCGPWFHSI